MRLIAPIILLLSLVDAATNADFENLKVALDDLYKAKPRMIPLTVRLAFHDLLHQPAAAGLGCIQKPIFQEVSGNGGLSEPVSELNQVISAQQFQDSNFQFGDVVAFASKIAVELAYPCIHIPFKFNRGTCNFDRPITTGPSTAPSPSMTTLSQMVPHQKYLGLTDIEFATLTVGAHAIKDAQASLSVSRWEGIFSKVSSGGDYITKSLSNTWIAQRIRGLLTLRSEGLIRIPSDMNLFFPDAKVEGSSGLFKRMENRPAQIILQEKLRALASDSKAFDAAFEQVYTKMLNAGGGTTVFQENFSKPQHCLREPSPSPQTTTSLQPADPVEVKPIEVEPVEVKPIEEVPAPVAETQETGQAIPESSSNNPESNGSEANPVLLLVNIVEFKSRIIRNKHN